MRFYLLQTGVEQSWQQQHLHLMWDGLDQDKWNYVFLPFCQAPYLSESMQLSPSRGEQEEMWIAIAGRYSNWTLSILPFKSGVKWNFFLTGRKYTREGATEITVRQLNLKLYINSVTVCASLRQWQNVTLNLKSVCVDTVKLSMCTWNLVI